ncbi:hypothetical protein K227x_22350 [Rubripirellula lacrimiformis]|uniref:Uncharacterized protein n=2 Tax=Rubripirellula lacrimiformis TaxID=1930273 RepID=A0A517N9P7_9BACT|nr:hypothetical protein K227x_22350 [Rubripirellula lacrimiformis]
MNKVLWTTVFAVLLGASCNRQNSANSDGQYLADGRESVAAGGSVHEGGQWHFDFTTVRAYRLNWRNEDAWEPIISGGELNATRMPTEGILLARSQVERLEAAVTGTHPDRGAGLCLYPHHAFLFFDGEGKVVGSIDVCFLCQSYRSQPAGYARNWDLLSIGELILDLGLPLRNPEWK